MIYKQAEKKRETQIRDDYGTRKPSFDLTDQPKLFFLIFVDRFSRDGDINQKSIRFQKSRMIIVNIMLIFMLNEVALFLFNNLHLNHLIHQPIQRIL